MGYTDEEKRIKVIAHKAKMNGYFLKMVIAIILIPTSFFMSTNTEGVLSIILIILTFICAMTAFIFKILHQGMLYCPLCGARFGYSSWMTSSIPAVCPHCDEKLYY